MVKVTQWLLALCSIILVISCAFTGFWWLKLYDWTQSSQETIHASITQAYNQLGDEARASLHTWSLVDIGLLIVLLIVVALLIVSVRIRDRDWRANQ